MSKTTNQAVTVTNSPAAVTATVSHSQNVSINLTVHVHIDGADLHPLLEQLLLALEATTAKR